MYGSETKAMPEEVTVTLNTRGRTETLRRHMDQHLSRRIGKQELTQNKGNCIHPLIWKRKAKSGVSGTNDYSGSNKSGYDNFFK